MSSRRPSWLNWFRAVLACSWINRQDRHSSAPRIVRVTPKSAALSERAWALSLRGREDAGAVEELVEMAHGDKKALVLARRRWQVDGLDLERRDHSRAVRLLEAAASRSAVQPEPSALTRLFDQVEILTSKPDAAQFAILIQHEPALKTIEDRLLLGASDTSISNLPSADRLHPPARTMRSIGVELRLLLGPAAHSQEPLLRTQTAYRIAAQHLGSMARRDH